MKFPSRQNSRQTQRGSALIAVFWLIAMMGMIVFVGVRVLETDTRVARTNRARIYAKQQAETVVNEAKAYQNAELPKAQAAADQLIQNAAYLKQARINPPLWRREDHERCDWEILGELGRAIATRLNREPVPARSTESIVEADFLLSSGREAWHSKQSIFTAA